MENKKTALITGASSGIGKAIYLKLVREGWSVYGTTRKVARGSVEEVDGGKMIFLEVTDESSVKEAIDMIDQKEGGLDALINNAGYGIAGAIEDTSHEEVAKLFDANFFGTLNVIRASTALLIKNKGIIVNISSVAGVLTVPFQGMYSATKAAMEAISESVRMEIKPYGVRVCLIEPGDTKTEFTQNRILVKNSKGSKYEETLAASIDRMAKDEQNGAPPEDVSDLVFKMIKRKNPPMRKAVGFSYQILVFLKRFLPDRLVMWIIAKMYA